MLSTWYSGIALVLLALLLAGVGVWLAHKRAPRELLRTHNEVAGPIHATLGVIYAVLLAFVVITVWEQVGSPGTELEFAL